MGIMLDDCLVKNNVVRMRGKERDGLGLGLLVDLSVRLLSRLFLNH